MIVVILLLFFLFTNELSYVLYNLQTNVPLKLIFLFLFAKNKTL